MNLENGSENKNRSRAKRFKQYRLRMTNKEDIHLKALSEKYGMSCADILRDALEKYRGPGGNG